MTAIDLAAATVMSAGNVTTSALAGAGRLATTGATLLTDAAVSGLKATSSVIATGFNAIGDAVSDGVAAAGSYVLDGFNGTVGSVSNVVGTIRNTRFNSAGDAWHVAMPSGNVYRCSRWFRLFSSMLASLADCGLRSRG